MTAIPTGFAPGGIVEAPEASTAPTTLTHEFEEGRAVWSFDPLDTPAVVIGMERKAHRLDADESNLDFMKPRELALIAAALEHSLNRVRAAQESNR